jgi:hypothetical protein
MSDSNPTGTEAVGVLSTQVEATKSSIRLSPDSLPGTVDTRVFVGGNYDLSPVLRFIAKLVKENGFVPIFVGDYDVPRDRINEYSMRLLFQCGRAIFEATVDNGQTMEIQKVAGEPYIKTLIAYMAYDESKTWPRKVSSMIKTLALSSSQDKQGYTTFDELTAIVLRFLTVPPPPPSY